MAPTSPSHAAAPPPARDPGTERLFGMDLPRPIARGIAVLIAVVVYAAVSSIARPGRSSAEPPGVKVTPTYQMPVISAARDGQKAVGAAQAPATNSRGERLLGQLIGGERLVWIYAGHDGARYTVATRDGRILQEDLAADDVYRSFPELDIPNMRLEPRPDPAAPFSGPLMSADKGA
jgi:hypothetical protein